LLAVYNLIVGLFACFFFQSPVKIFFILLYVSRWIMNSFFYRTVHALFVSPHPFQPPFPVRPSKTLMGVPRGGGEKSLAKVREKWAAVE